MTPETVTVAFRLPKHHADWLEARAGELDKVSNRRVTRSSLLAQIVGEAYLVAYVKHEPRPIRIAKRIK